jgi:hypothetical protein
MGRCCPEIGFFPLRRYRAGSIRGSRQVEESPLPSGDVRHPLCVLNKVVQLGSMQGLGKGQAARGVVRRIVPEAAHQCHVPGALLDDLQNGPNRGRASARTGVVAALVCCRCIIPRICQDGQLVPPGIPTSFCNAVGQA